MSSIYLLSNGAWQSIPVNFLAKTAAAWCCSSFLPKVLAPLISTLSIVDKFIIQVEAQLEDKGVYLSIDKKAKEYLADIGYDEVYGARELGRVIQEKVKKPMAEELIFGALSKGGHVDITIDKNEISLKYSSNQDKKKELV